MEAAQVQKIWIRIAMALSIDPATRIISVPQGDLTLVSGTIYKMDTESYFRTELMLLMESEDFIWMPDAFSHNTENTVAGVIYSRAINIINGFSVKFIPDSQWTVILEGSNNNIFDVENGILEQNQVQVISTNAAGLIVSGSGVTEQDKDDIANKTWAIDATLLTDRSTIGGYVARSLLSLKNFLGNK